MFSWLNVLTANSTADAAAFSGSTPWAVQPRVCQPESSLDAGSVDMFCALASAKLQSVAMLTHDAVPEPMFGVNVPVAVSGSSGTELKFHCVMMVCASAAAAAKRPAARAHKDRGIRRFMRSLLWLTKAGSGGMSSVAC